MVEMTEPSAASTVRPRVLVADDDAALCAMCSSVLQPSGFDVSLAREGPGALDLVQRGAYDILLVDRRLPEVDGLTLLRATLAARPDTVVIMMADDLGLDACIEALREGAWDFLRKPFSAAHLQVLVARAAHTLQVSHKPRGGSSTVQSVAPTELPREPVLGNPESFIATLFEESYHAARDRVIQLFERQYLLWLVNRAAGNLTEAARMARVNRTTLYRMMERNGLQRAPSLGWLAEVGSGADETP
jgi:DNA-binding NtrC family response regulator